MLGLSREGEKGKRRFQDDGGFKFIQSGGEVSSKGTRKNGKELTGVLHHYLQG
jgi:hypothetical protein